jgi:putative ABC transport system permease protein
MNTRLIHHSILSMGRSKLRTFFMMLGTVIGVTALTIVISVGETAQRTILQTIGRIFGDASIIVLDGGGKNMANYRGVAARLKTDDLEAVLKQVPEITTWDPQQVLSANVRYGSASHTAEVLGQTQRFEQVWNRTTSRGESFDESAVTGAARVAIIGETIAHELFGSEDPVGKDIQIGSVPFRVIGVLEPWGTDPHGMDRDNEVVVPITTLMRRLTNLDTISAAKLLVDDPKRAEESREQVRRILRERHALVEGEPDDFTIVTATDARKMVARLQKILFLYLPLVAAIALIAGGIVSATLMVSSVQERVAEIGLKRAVGARPEDIKAQFLLESTLATVIGGVVGIILGSALANLAAANLHLNGVTPLPAALIGLVASSVVGLAAGVLPAARAARLHPVEALR